MRGLRLEMASAIHLQPAPLGEKGDPGGRDAAFVVIELFHEEPRCRGADGRGPGKRRVPVMALRVQVQEPMSRGIRILREPSQAEICGRRVFEEMMIRGGASLNHRRKPERSMIPR